MLYLLMDEYPVQIREKIKNPTNQPFNKTKTANL